MTDKLQQIFITWYHNEFSQTKLFMDMQSCSEKSKWHRERNVAVHTNMVVAEYVARTQMPWNHRDLLGALVCAFHDIGKPGSRVEKHNEERGTYYSFGGHELLSARMWENYIVANWQHMSDLFDLNQEDIYRISWAIEHHRPWGLKKVWKRQNMTLTAKHTIGLDVFKRILIADNWGRIGDTQEENRASVVKWIEEFVEFAESLAAADKWKLDDIQLPVYHDGNAPTLYMAIGCSGSGKSSYYKMLDHTVHYSWDALRHKWYDEDNYALAFQASVEDSEFKNKVKSEFSTIVDLRHNVYVDNVNTSTKRRQWFLEEAKRKGYNCVAVLFPIAAHTAINRQNTRTDKTIPPGAVMGQYNRLQMPQFGEFDEIEIANFNLAKYQQISHEDR